MPFPSSVVEYAWRRQAGLCAYCGKRLKWGSRDKGAMGAWHAHHRRPEDYGGSNTLRNCVIFCINEPENCHLNVGHDGDWDNYCPLSDRNLRYLHAGRRKRMKSRNY